MDFRESDFFTLWNIEVDVHWNTEIMPLKLLRYFAEN